MRPADALPKVEDAGMFMVFVSVYLVAEVAAVAGLMAAPTNESAQP